jgi:hypothetical protein
MAEIGAPFGKTPDPLANDWSAVAPYVASVIAPAFAFSFNVGYFFAIDISWFTFFTLSEHIVFAIKVLPVGIGGAIILWIALSLSEHFDETTCKAPHNRLNAISCRFIQYCKSSTIFWIWLNFVLICALLVALLMHRIGLSLSVLAVAAGAVAHHLTRPQSKSFENILYWATNLIMITFIVGYVSGHWWLISYQQHSLIGVGDKFLVGNIIATGEQRAIVWQSRYDSPWISRCLGQNLQRGMIINTEEGKWRAIHLDERNDISLCP